MIAENITYVACVAFFLAYLTCTLHIEGVNTDFVETRGDVNTVISFYH